MLTSLTVKNFGLMDDCSAEFSPKLNIFTGETGAGKTLLIDALRFVLGDKITSSHLRDAQKPCVVEAVFELSKDFLANNEVFNEYKQDDERSFVIHRSFSPDKPHKIKINGFNLTVSELKSLGNTLIDFHGANEHQTLFESEYHIMILDRLSNFAELKEEYKAAFLTYSESLHELENLEKLASTREREIEILSSQVKELEQLPLSEDKFFETQSKLARLENSEKLYESVNSLLELLQNEEIGLTSTASKLFAPMEKLNDLDASTEKYGVMLTDLDENARNLTRLLSEYASSLEYDPEEAADIYRQNDIYYQLQRKYGPTIGDVERFYAETKIKYGTLCNLENNTSELNKETIRKKNKAFSLAKKLSEKRLKQSKILAKIIEEELKELGIKHVQFETRITECPLNKNGIDNVEFYISPNAGEELKPMAEIISSGEAARVMLALKKALINVDPVPVLIFDEIDAQIGGRLGTVTGKKLKELSKNHQVLLITHLPQIASFADRHFKVVKNVTGGKTSTSLEVLEKDLRVEELAKMMSGEKINETSIKHAREMLKTATDLNS
ncbi:MAG: DNA repair protein RecN [Candidatus Omnitrophica bacterium]|nr:DNA repair protein RecN [Candidatus Omnitrophota bacterium]